MAKFNELQCNKYALLIHIQQTSCLTAAVQTQTFSIWNCN